jgi:hypothetical protein
MQRNGVVQSADVSYTAGHATAAVRWPSFSHIRLRNVTTRALRSASYTVCCTHRQQSWRTWRDSSALVLRNPDWSLTESGMRHVAG